MGGGGGGGSGEPGAGSLEGEQAPAPQACAEVALLRCQLGVWVAGHPREPSIWQGMLEPQCHEAPVEAPSSAGEEGGGAEAEGCPALARNTGATGPPFPPGVAQMALLCSCSPQSRGAGVLTSLANVASVPHPAWRAPMSICQQVSTSCPPVLREFAFHVGAQEEVRAPCLPPSGLAEEKRGTCCGLHVQRG